MVWPGQLDPLSPSPGDSYSGPGVGGGGTKIMVRPQVLPINYMCANCSRCGVMSNKVPLFDLPGVQILLWPWPEQPERLPQALQLLIFRFNKLSIMSLRGGEGLSLRSWPDYVCRAPTEYTCT